MQGFPDAFKNWRRPLEKTIDQTLATNFDKAEANQIIRYMFRTGGKRCRPLLVALSTEAFGVEWPATFASGSEHVPYNLVCLSLVEICRKSLVNRLLEGTAPILERIRK